MGQNMCMGYIRTKIWIYNLKNGYQKGQIQCKILSKPKHGYQTQGTGYPNIYII